jgi:NTP pyrophosphatase (non-canonical NTP hydrolase)
MSPIEGNEEALRILQEECAEVVQAISKVFRFGEDTIHQGFTNRESLEVEVGDLLCMVDILVENCFLSDSHVNAARKMKREKLKLWSTVAQKQQDDCQYHPV